MRCVLSICEPRVAGAGDPASAQCRPQATEHSWGEPLTGPAARMSRTRAQRVYPTDPVISNSISLLSSTAYSRGSRFVTGSMNPLTIIFSAFSSDSPRDIR